MFVVTIVSNFYFTKSTLFICNLQIPNLNPRPDTVFRHLRSDKGGCDPPPLGVSKRSVVELSEKGQQIALAEYSRLLVLFYMSIFDPVMAGQRSNFQKLYDFSTLRVHISKPIYRSRMKPSPACSPFNSA